MKITIELEIEAKDVIRLRDNSVERVINTSIKIAQAAEKASNKHLAELGSTSWQDWEELKPLVDRLWRAAQNAINS